MIGFTRPPPLLLWGVQHVLDALAWLQQPQRDTLMALEIKNSFSIVPKPRCLGPPSLPFTHLPSYPFQLSYIFLTLGPCQ